jgi:hypothetical protein
VIYRFFKFQKTLDGDDIITFDFLHTYIHHPHTATCLAHLSFLTCTHSRYNLPAALCTFLFLRAGSFSDSLFFVAEGTGNNAPIKALFGWTGSNPKGGLIHAGNKWIPLLSLIPFGGLIPLIPLHYSAGRDQLWGGNRKQSVKHAAATTFLYYPLNYSTILIKQHSTR